MSLQRKLFPAIVAMMLTTAAHAVMINDDGGGPDPAIDAKGLGTGQYIADSGG
jgi:hypothetical protein